MLLLYAALWWLGSPIWDVLAWWLRVLWQPLALSAAGAMVDAAMMLGTAAHLRRDGLL